MQCMSCSNDVPSKFTYAITQNACPSCGKQIMPAELQKVLSSLHEIMTLAAEQSYDKEALNWISSNFNLLSRDGEEMTALKAENDTLATELKTARTSLINSKPIPKSGKEIEVVEMGVDSEGHRVQLQGETIQTPEATSVFMERANVSRNVNANKDIKKIADQIRGKRSVKESEGNPSIITADQIAEVDPTEVEEMEMMLAGGNMPGIQSALVSSSEYDDFDALPPIAEAFARQGEGGRQSNQQGGYNAKDVAALQRLQAKSQNAQRAMLGVGSAGKITRSG